MKINKTFFAAALVAVAFTSCETKENSHRETQPFSMLNYVTNGTEQAYSLGTSAISIEYIGTSASSLSVRNVVMTSGTASSFEVTGLNNKNVTNGMGFDLSSTSSATGMSDISISLLGGTSWIQQWNLFYRFTVGSDKVYGMPMASNYFSLTRVNDPATGTEIWKTEEAAKNRYQIVINEKDVNTANRTLDLYVAGASFMQNMPAMNMVFKNIPFSIENGRLTFAIDRLTPSVLTGDNADKEVPNDKFPITDLQGGGTIGEELSLNFSCTPTLTEGSSTTYNVVSTLKFRFQKQNNQQ